MDSTRSDEPKETMRSHGVSSDTGMQLKSIPSGGRIAMVNDYVNPDTLSQKIPQACYMSFTFQNKNNQECESIMQGELASAFIKNNHSFAVKATLYKLSPRSTPGMHLNDSEFLNGLALSGHWKDTKWDLGTIPSNSGFCLDLGRCIVPIGTKKEARSRFILVICSESNSQPIVITKQILITH
jgi:hypothetical protein